MNLPMASSNAKQVHMCTFTSPKYTEYPVIAHKLLVIVRLGQDSVRDRGVGFRFEFGFGETVGGP